MNIIKYLNNAGYDTVDTGFYTLINTWKSWYIGDVRKFHRYKMYNGKEHVSCRRLSPVSYSHLVRRTVIENQERNASGQQRTS